MAIQPEEPSLKRLQEELARHLTAPLREPLRNSWHGLATADIDRSRETLIRKRISQTRSCLPRTAKSLGHEFEKFFREFSSSHHFNGHNAIALDAIAFAKWLRACVRVSAWVGQLAVWESLDCEWHERHFFVHIRRFHYDFFSMDVTSEPAKRRAQYWLCVRFFSWYRRARILS